MIKQTEYHKNESGRSMIEMIGVLALMGLITAVAFTLIQSVMTSQNVSRTADDINTLVANVRSISAGRSDFSNLPKCDTSANSQNATKAKSLAAAILAPDITGTTVNSPFGGTYGVCYDKSYPTYFFVYIYKMKDADCKMMEFRSFSGGTATCDNKILKIKY